MNDSNCIKGRTAIVTGGGQGLGEAICLWLAQEGCNVVVADINPSSIQNTVQRIKTEHDALAVGIVTDITQEEQVAKMVDHAVAEFGSLDIIVSNAGILIAKAIDDFPAAEWLKVIEVNLFGYFLCAKHAARVMKERHSGVIIQINSKSGKTGSYKNSAYASSKFGGIGLTQSLALELAEFGIRVNAICPGNMLDSPLWTDSLFDQYSRTRSMTVDEIRQYYIDKVPLKRGCTYADVCDLLVFLVSDRSSYMTGQAINVTGGQEMH